MKLNKISYKKKKEWEYNDLELKDINLIVGKMQQEKQEL